MKADPQQDACVYAVGTMDTKGEELQFVAQCLQDAGVSVRTVDVSTQAEPTVLPDVSREIVTGGAVHELSTDRGEAVTQMSGHLSRFLTEEQAAGRVSGVLGIGGSGGTALISAALRSLPIGLPKIMVSTVASGNTLPYVDCSDITMMPSVVDIAGLNAVSRRILANAAHAMAGMVSHLNYEEERASTIGMTMFGVTTPCVSRIRTTLEARGHDCLVFHATGTGGRAMERLVDAGFIQGVLDITTTEVADEIIGGIFPAGPHRFEAIVSSQVPCVLSLGALDMVNFGGIDSVPEEFRNRNLHIHNAQVTLMRTSEAENRQFGHWIASRLRRATAPVTVLIPQKGLSALDIEGGVFFDEAADAALFETLTAELSGVGTVRIVNVPHHINDPKFADTAIDEYLLLTENAR